MEQKKNADGSKEFTAFWASRKKKLNSQWITLKTTRGTV